MTIVAPQDPDPDTERGTTGPTPAASTEADGAKPLIGVEDLEPPTWVSVDERVAEAGVWRTVAAIPGVIAVVVRLAWDTSPRLTLLVGLVQLVSGGVTGLGLFATAGVFTELLEAGPTPQRMIAALPAITAVVAAYALRGSLDAMVGAVQGALTPRVVHTAHARLNVAVAGVDLAAFDDPDFRELIRQGGQRGVNALEYSTRAVADIASSLISMSAALVTAAILNPWLAPVLLLAAVADAWAAMRVAKLGYRSFLRMVTRRLRLGVVENLLTGRDVAVERHALTLQGVLVAEHHRIAESLTAEAVRLERRKSAVRLVGRALAGIGTGVAYVVLGLLLYTRAMPLAVAGAAVVAMRAASNALSNTMHGVNQLYEQSFYITFYRRLLAVAQARHRTPSDIVAPADPLVIRLENVSFTYPDAAQPALTDVNLTIRRGQIIALVGENGSGKTTLGKLVTGLYTPTAGTVWWDDIDIATADQLSVHSQIAVIAQEPARWPMTAAANIRVGRLDRDDPDGSAWDAAITRSGAHEVLATLPYGERTVLSKEFKAGHDLSGGQWQRVSVARGIYRDAVILVADEPTAALDAKAESRVFAGLRHAARHGDGDQAHRTTILVTHRLANVRDADRIIVLDRGRIVEQGTHDELIAAGGAYRELFDIQARAYRDGPVTHRAATGG